MRSLADFIHINERHNGTREAVVDSKRRYTHDQLSHRAWAIARGLLALGVRPGEHVGVLACNGVFSAETFLGTVAAGAVYVPYNWRWATAELVHGINDSQARVVLVDDECRDAFAKARDSGELAHVRAVVHEGDEFEGMLGDDSPLDLHVDLESIACMLYTGGTTGFSKGVELSHRAILSNALNEIVDCRIGQAHDDRGLIVVPMFHSAALLCWFLPHYVTGAASVFMRRFDEDEFGWLVERERITNFFLIPNMIRRLHRAGVLHRDGVRRQVRAIHSGGGTLRMPDKEAVREAMPDTDLYFRYGLTEAGPMVTRLQPRDVFRPEVDGSIGKEYFLAEVELRGADDRQVPVGEVGELCVRGPGLMRGYFNRPEATAEALRGGWLHTGDLAVRDEEGFIYFRDRAKDMVKSGGENVYSAEIEQLLYTHPAVMEAVVVGVPSEEWDEEVRAVVSVRPGQRVGEDDLKTFLRGSLAGYKVPKRIAFLAPEEMPINPSGKILKSEVRRIVGW
ncbi:MAG: AMP-binding protein [Microbispora sp.]|nr:AMP-binding protein [Microbispora sp.]